jgi:hypothetical protein
MIGLFCFVVVTVGSPFKSKLRLEAENAVLRHQEISCAAAGEPHAPVDPSFRQIGTGNSNRELRHLRLAHRRAA